MSALRTLHASVLSVVFAWGIWVSPACVRAQEANSADRMEPAAAAEAAVPASPIIFVPLTKQERFQRYLKNLVSPASLVTEAAVAGFGQLRDSPKEWGEGAEGFGMRYGSAFGEHVVRESITFGAASALHEDNHYIRSGRSGFGSRILYAVESTFLARREDGLRCVSISRIGGFAGAAAISRLWQPPSTSGAMNAFSNFSTELGVAAGMNVVREFLPDLLHKK